MIEAARASDLPAVRHLLEASALPSGDVTAARLAHYLVDGHAGALRGVIGLEPAGRVGLLRSLAVARADRGRGLGQALTAALERHARGLGIAELYLLTTTAERFFGALGYRAIPRAAAPPSLQATTEFRELCSSSAVCMVKTLEPKEQTMAGNRITRPAADEYAPYYGRYIAQVPDVPVLELLERQVADTVALLGTLGDRGADFRYAEGKWSVKEVVGHVTDVERIFAYRALCFARGERGSLPGFEENDYVARAKFSGRTLADLVAEFRLVRAATVAFFAGLDAEELTRRGTANNNPYSVRALAFIIAGHERHHAKILAERYLPGLAQR